MCLLRGTDCIFNRNRGVNFCVCQVQNSGWCSAPSLCCLLKHSTSHYATFYTSQHFTHFQRTFTRRTSGNCLGIFRTLNFSDSLMMIAFMVIIIIIGRSSSSSRSSRSSNSKHHYHLSLHAPFLLSMSVIRGLFGK
jgi:hypothetical protein